jgi:hypothetical protein
MLQEQFSEFHKYCADLGLKPSQDVVLIAYRDLMLAQHENAPQGRYGDNEWQNHEGEMK